MISAISTIAAFLRPMYCDSTPSGNRIRAPAMIGTDTMKPFWAASRPKVSLMNGAIAPLSTQIAKVKSKYRNEASSVGQCPDRRKVLTSDISHPLRRHCVTWRPCKMQALGGREAAPPTGVRVLEAVRWRTDTVQTVRVQVRAAPRLDAAYRRSRGTVVRILRWHGNGCVVDLDALTLRPDPTESQGSLTDEDVYPGCGDLVA